MTEDRLVKSLILNPGSTSTKIAYFENENEIISKNLSHSAEDLDKFHNVIEQKDFRIGCIWEFIQENNIIL